MSNVEIYDSSNSQLSSDEYSHEEGEYDALMDAAVSKERPQKIKDKAEAPPKPEEDEKLPEIKADQPPSTRAETLRRIRQLQLQRRRWPNLYFKRRSMRWLRPNKLEYNTYLEGLKDLLPKRRSEMARLNARRRRNYDSRSRSRSPSRSRSRSPSRSPSSRSRSYSRSRSGSHSPELICLDDTENEESPEKPDNDHQENKARIMAPPQLNFETPEKLKAKPPGGNENGASVLEEFLIRKELLSATMELQQAINQQHEVEDSSLAVDSTLKRRRSVTPPQSKAIPDADDDDTIEFMQVQEGKSVEAAAAAAAPLNLQMPSTPVANPPSFKLSTPYSLAPPVTKPPAENLTPISYSLNTPTPPATPMEITYPNEKLLNNTKPNSLTQLTAVSYAQATPQVAAIVKKPPVQAAPLQKASLQPMALPRAAPLQQMAQLRSGPPQQLAPPKSGPPHQLPPPKSVQPQQLAAPPKAGQPQQLAAPPRAAPPQQFAAPKEAPPQQFTAPKEAAPQPQLQHHLPPVVPPSFVVPQQPQPRRSDTVSTQTQQVPQSPPIAPSTSRQKPNIDLNNSDANFHFRIRELFGELNSIVTDKVNSIHPNKNSLAEERERIDADLKTLDNLIVQKEEEYNRLLHLRCVKEELRSRLERKERVTIVKELLPMLLNKSCSTDELQDMQAILEEEQEAPMASKRGLSAVEQCLNYAELNQNNIRLLRGVMGLKEQAPPVSPRHFEEEGQLFRRNSLPARRSTMRDARYTPNEPNQRELNAYAAPLAKRPRLLHPQDRYHQEMTSSTPNLASTSSSSHRIQGAGKPPHYSNMSLDNHFENESLLKPLFNSSPMGSQRQLANRQYHESHSTHRNDEEMDEIKPKSDKIKPLGHKSNNKSQREFSAPINGKEERRCHECKLNEATYLCSSCQNQWYCSRECQLRAWDTHYQTCGV
ncbi:serine/arginine repetitive matrix protein 1 [Drosophila takahashii]|uniref:serine/arginine repetitive matrix protein 1 n=1 Tax=Drosophila takahashii TaxID=29030 RepID=UPI0038993EC5